jgi:CubicO group peptidase (beta-lactamase class C family)
MTSCDNLVNNFILTHNIPGASIAIAKNGKLVYHRAFGKADIAGNTNTRPDHLFRIASISKPITSIAIMNMLEQNQLSLSDKVFGPDGILENHAIISNATISDARIYDITVQHLLEHSAGWDRGVNCFPNPTSPYPYYFSGCDPIVAPLHVTESNQTQNPATDEDMIVYLLEKGLDFAPNTRYAYSNIGYLVLGKIVEALSGQSYENYVKESILNQLGICDMHLGKNLIADKQEREVEYIGNGYNTLSCYNTGIYVPWEYGGFSIEAMGAHGGWIATTRDLVSLLLAVDGFNTKPDILKPSTIATMTTPSINNSFYAKGWSVNTANNWWHSGSLDGTASFFARTSGQYTWAILLNKRVIGPSANQFWTDLDNLPWNCIAQTASFPSHDLLDIPQNNSANIEFSDIGPNAVSLSWTNGSGNKGIVVGREGHPIEDFPLDGEAYMSNSSFSQGDDLGNNSYVVYNGTGNATSVNNLKPNTTYFFRIFDYNESFNTGNNALFKLCGGDQQQVTTEEPLNSNSFHGIEGVKIYPTLVSDRIHLEVPPHFKTSNFQIFTVSGALRKRGSFVDEAHTIHISDLSPGMYILQIEGNAGQRVKVKVVKP